MNVRKSYNELPGPENQSSDYYTGEPLPKDAQINLTNLISVDEKLNALAECLKKNTTSQIS